MREAAFIKEVSTFYVAKDECCGRKAFRLPPGRCNYGGLDQIGLAHGSGSWINHVVQAVTPSSFGGGTCRYSKPTKFTLDCSQGRA